MLASDHNNSLYRVKMGIDSGKNAWEDRERHQELLELSLG